MENILTTIDVDKQYGANKVLDRISIEVPRGSIYGLLGPNGAGKTTLIRIINQITAPDGGDVYLEGRPLERNDITQIGYLPEERGLYRKMKVGEQALYLAKLKGLNSVDARQQVRIWFEKFGIESWWNRKVEELSKGMQQKVQFIIAVLHRPSLLILDEPFSGFDPINADMLKNEILQLREQGATIILSTHNMASVEEMCDYISLINKSRCILKGNVNEIRRRYKSGDYELCFEGELNNQVFQEFKNSKIQEFKDSKLEHQQSKIVIHAPETSGNALLTKLIPLVNIISFKEILPSMNDIFIRKVNEQSHE